MKRSRKKLWISLVILAILAGIATAVILNRVWIIDFVRGMGYEPTSEMARIRDELELTDRGEFLFKATHPKLSEKDDFNKNCRQAGDSEIAVLGCYTNNDIYIYNITESELNGIRELTTAHELLHAVWARMGENERKNWETVLNRVYNDNQEILKDEIETYVSSERQEELYVRAGTEIKNLPASLEEHYAEIFKDQDKIVDFYDKYISVFKEIEERMNELKSEMDEMGGEIDLKTKEYERRSGQLEADVVSFNACAKQAGCFETQAEFYARRRELVSEQEALNTLYEELNRMIQEYNALVNEYNSNVIKSQDLNQKINSNTRPEGLE